MVKRKRPTLAEKRRGEVPASPYLVKDYMRRAMQDEERIGHLEASLNAAVSEAKGLRLDVEGWKKANHVSEQLAHRLNARLDEVQRENALLRDAFGTISLLARSLEHAGSEAKRWRYEADVNSAAGGQAEPRGPNPHFTGGE